MKRIHIHEKRPLAPPKKSLKNNEQKKNTNRAHDTVVLRIVANIINGMFSFALIEYFWKKKNNLTLLRFLSLDFCLQALRCLDQHMIMLSPKTTIGIDLRSKNGPTRQFVHRWCKRYWYPQHQRCLGLSSQDSIFFNPPIPIPFKWIGENHISNFSLKFIFHSHFNDQYRSYF